MGIWAMSAVAETGCMIGRGGMREAEGETARVGEGGMSAIGDIREVGVWDGAKLNSTNSREALLPFSPGWRRSRDSSLGLDSADSLGDSTKKAAPGAAAAWLNWKAGCAAGRGVGAGGGVRPP